MPAGVETVTVLTVSVAVIWPAASAVFQAAWRWSWLPASVRLGSTIGVV